MFPRGGNPDWSMIETTKYRQFWYQNELENEQNSFFLILCTFMAIIIL